MIELVAVDDLVLGEPGKIFSTSPRVATGGDGKTYYVKGRNDPIAFAEVAGCRVAALVGLKVPTAEVGRFGDDLYAAIEEVPDTQRTMHPWLRQPERINNWSHLFEVVAVDTWLANDDRNMGNVVGSSLSGGRIEVFMIDFEKSRTLRERPFTAPNEITEQRLWPTAQLGQLLKRCRPQSCPGSILRAIYDVSVQRLEDAILPVAQDLPFVTWHQDSVEALRRRAQRITPLVEAVWKTN